jgi:glycosyltransferase involved in cell wall biosynthesis
MRVCFFIPRLKGGGAERQCAALLGELQKNPSIDIHLVVLGSTDHDDRLEVANLTVHRIDLQDFGDPRALAFVIRTLRQVRPDVLLSWLHPADIWSYAATRVVRGVPWIMTERDSAYPDEFAHNLRIKLGRRAAAMIIANSEEGRQLWAGIADHPPLRVIPNLVTVPVTPPSGLADRSDSADCLYVGRLEPKKNILLMAEGFALFTRNVPEARMVVAGVGSQAEELEDFAERQGSASSVELLGFHDDVPALMARSRLFLSLSKYEGMPNTLMEAVAVGLPAVVSDIPSHRTLLGDDYPYFVGVDASPEEVEKVIAAAWNHGCAADIYRHGRDVLATMTPARVAAAYVDAFAEVVAAEAGTRRRRGLRRTAERPPTRT